MSDKPEAEGLTVAGDAESMRLLLKEQKTRYEVC